MAIKKASKKAKKFVQDRGWDEYHHPKELSIKLLLEAAELLDLFEWMNEDDVKRAMKNEEFKKALADEIADIFTILLQFSQNVDIDIMDAFEQKHSEIEKRFPVEKAKRFDPVLWKLKKLKSKSKTSL